MINKNNLFFLLGLVALVLMVPGVLGSGVSSPYWLGENASDINAKPLIMYPSETKDFSFVLQNIGGTENESFKVSIIGGSEVISSTDENSIYTVPAGASDVRVNFSARVPMDATKGTVYKIELEFLGSSAANAGQFQFGSSVIKKFDLIVGEKPIEPVEETSEIGENSTTNYLLIFLIGGVIVAIIILSLVIARKKK